MKIWALMGILAGAILAGVIYTVASPYIAVNAMHQAAIQRDADTLVEYIDFPQVRQNLKDQLNAMMLDEMTTSAADNPFAVLGMAMGGALVEQFVDALVTPAGLISVMNGGSLDPAADPNPPTLDDADIQMSYQAWDRFHVQIAAPDADTATVLVLRRTGLWQWQVTDIRLPITP
jgi:hypothetical protein